MLSVQGHECPGQEVCPLCKLIAAVEMFLERLGEELRTEDRAARPQLSVGQAKHVVYKLAVCIFDKVVSKCEKSSADT